MKYDFNDILIQPAVQTDINSRRHVYPFDKNGMLPIFTGPMDTVVDEKNFLEFKKGKINVCFPREKEYHPSAMNPTEFSSISLDEFIKIYIERDKNIQCSPEYVLIDMANGHLLKMTNAIIESKKKYGDKIFLMVGNIANPETYKVLSDAGADAIRCGIGNGNSCSTTQQLGVGFPMASLIKECYDISLTLSNPALIIADGGMKGYSDVIKALALGSNFVMIGSIFNKCLESCGKTRFLKYIKINPNSKFAKWAHKKGFKLTKRFRGMSTKEVQKNWGNETIKTSEGVVRVRPVEYTIAQWTENFEDYLRSAMSYTNSRTLSDFIGKVKTNLIS